MGLRAHEHMDTMDTISYHIISYHVMSCHVMNHIRTSCLRPTSSMQLSVPKGCGKESAKCPTKPRGFVAKLSNHALSQYLVSIQIYCMVPGTLKQRGKRFLWSAVVLQIHAAPCANQGSSSDTSKPESLIGSKII